MQLSINLYAVHACCPFALIWTTCLPSTEKRGKAWLCLDWEKISAEMSSLLYLPNCAKKLLLELLLKIWRRIAPYSRKSANVYSVPYQTVFCTVYEEDR